MSRLTPWIVLVGVLLAVGASWAVNGPQSQQYQPQVAQNMTRPCSYSGVTKSTVAATGATTASSSAFTRGSVVRMACSTAVHFRMGTTAPTAVTTDPLLPANTVEWFVSEADYVAVIQDASAGTCYFAECR